MWKFALGLLLSLNGPIALSQQSGSDLAKQLANPIASLISVPLQGNWDRNLGPLEDGRRFTLNVQPVIPVPINDKWNLISRTILPVIDQDDIFPASGGQTGIGDTTQSLFFSPKEPTRGGVTWGVGPVLLVPTATDDLLGGEKWGAGPTAVVLKQRGPWTVGALVNQIWSFAGSDNRQDINQTFVQPFFTYTTPTAWSFTLTSESTYNRENSQWTVPVGVFAAKVFKIGEQSVQLQAGPRYYAESPASGAEGWGFRLNFVMLFPKGGSDR